MRIVVLVLALLGPALAEEPPALSVTIRGVDGELKDNVAAFLQINQLAQSDQPLPGEARLRWLHSRAEQDIREALQPFGYFKPTVEASLEATDNGWSATYVIDPGPPLPIATLDIRLLGEGKDDRAFQRIIERSPLAQGKTLDQRQYEQLKSSLQSAATERGYFDARLVANRIVVDMDAYQALVIVHYDTGKRYRFGDVTFKGGELWPALLHRYVQFQPGDPYVASKLLELQSDLLASDYFDQVIIDAPPGTADQRTIPVTVELAMRKRSKYTFGLGYATDTGVRGRFDFERRWVNRRGHSIETQAFASQISFGLAAAYVIPGKDPRTDAYKLRVKIDSENSDAKEFLNASIGFSKQFQDGPWTKLYSLDYLWERFDSGPDRKTSRLLMPSLQWSRIDARNRLDIRNGSSLTLNARAAAEPLLSTLSFAQFSLQYKLIRTLDTRHRLLARVQAGTTLIDGADFDEFPSSLRFYAGGDNSVRGYALDSIGPRDNEDNVLGGRQLLVGSLEYEYRFRENWGAAVFVDAGDAFDDAPEFKVGAGIGLRWQSPVGPVKLDLAHGFEEPGDPFRIHFSIGPEL